MSRNSEDEKEEDGGGGGGGGKKGGRLNMFSLLVFHVWLLDIYRFHLPLVGKPKIGKPPGRNVSFYIIF